MITAVFTTVLGALIIAGIFAVIKSHWLYVIAPKLYLNTPISEGQIVTLDLYNAGLGAEEDVTLTIRPACKFELIATSKSTLVVNNNLLTVTKLSRYEKITVLLLVEGRAFEQADIESIESKAAKGKIVESKENAIPSWQPVVALPVLLLILALPFAFGTWIGAETGTSAWRFVNDRLELFGRSVQLAGYQEFLTETYGSGKLKGAVRSKKIEIEIKEIVQYGEKYTVNFSVSNHLDTPILVDGLVKTSAGELELFARSPTGSFAVAPNEKNYIKVSVTLPDEVRIKIINCNFTIKTVEGDNLGAEQTIRLDKS